MSPGNSRVCGEVPHPKATDIRPQVSRQSVHAPAQEFIPNVTDVRRSEGWVMGQASPGRSVAFAVRNSDGFQAMGAAAMAPAPTLRKVGGSSERDHMSLATLKCAKVAKWN